MRTFGLSHNNPEKVDIHPHPLSAGLNAMLQYKNDNAWDEHIAKQPSVYVYHEAYSEEWIESDMGASILEAPSDMVRTSWRIDRCVWRNALWTRAGLILSLLFLIRGEGMPMKLQFKRKSTALSASTRLTTRKTEEYTLFFFCRDEKKMKAKGEEEKGGR